MIYFPKGLTKKQREVFEQIAIGNDSGHHPTIIKNLLKKELIEKRGIRYDVPLLIHMEWCEWCSKNYYTEEELLEADKKAEKFNTIEYD